MISGASSGRLDAMDSGFFRRTLRLLQFLRSFRQFELLPSDLSRISEFDFGSG